MVSIVLIGTGNIAQHLYEVIKGLNNANLVQVVGRNTEALAYFSVATTSNFSAIDDADLYLIAVSDDAIPEIATYLQMKNGLIAHTSGSVSIDALTPNNRIGVFYPLQTFTKGKKVDFSKIPICIEANNKKDLSLLQKLGDSISEVVKEISSEQRKTLHLAAVFVNNFTNHMFTIAEDICKKDAISFDILKPLIEETVHKIENLSPKDAQTGPAIRNDVLTMQRHIEQLTNPLQKRLYLALSESIRNVNYE